LEVFRGQFQLLTDDGRMFATESSEPDSVGNQYSGLTHFGALLERTKRTIRANQANDPSERSERTTKSIYFQAAQVFRLPKSERRARPIKFFA
jgi:hypothetical protein